VQGSRHAALRLRSLGAIHVISVYHFPLIIHLGVGFMSRCVCRCVWVKHVGIRGTHASTPERNTAGVDIELLRVEDLEVHEKLQVIFSNEPHRIAPTELARENGLGYLQLLLIADYSQVATRSSW